jgi:LPS sulfotransferase NodH
LRTYVSQYEEGWDAYVEDVGVHYADAYYEEGEEDISYQVEVVSSCQVEEEQTYQGVLPYQGGIVLDDPCYYASSVDGWHCVAYAVA